MPKKKTIVIVEEVQHAEIFCRLISRLVAGIANGCSTVFAADLEGACRKVREDAESEYFILADPYHSGTTLESFVTELREHLGGRLRETVITSAYDGTERLPEETKRLGLIFLPKPWKDSDWKPVATAIELFLTT
jgi:hypothetical protein